MPDRVFYVGSMNDEKKLTGYVPGKFLMRNGSYVMNPTPGGSQQAYIYSDGLGNNKMSGELANPHNYLIVPENYTEQKARDFAAGVASSPISPLPMIPAFHQGGSQDLQRHPQWGIPDGSVVPAFVGPASENLGYETALAGFPKWWAEFGGGASNLLNSGWQQVKPLLNQESTKIDTSAPYYLSRQNYDNISQGYSAGIAARKPPAPFNDYGRSPQTDPAANSIGDGNGIGGGLPGLIANYLASRSTTAWPTGTP